MINLFVPISKVDKERRMAYGWASTPTKDSQGDVILVSAIKKALPDYLVWGNVREMHGRSAVGVVKESKTNDDGWYVGCKIVDDAAWEKVKEGVYKGFSIGGSELGRKGDTITELEITELSIVDRPANSECRVDTWKASGLDHDCRGVCKGEACQIIEHDECHNEKCRSCIKRYADSKLTKVAGIDGFIRWEPRVTKDAGSGRPAASSDAQPEGAAASASDGGRGAPGSKVAERSDTKPSEGESKYGNVEFADPKNKKYPIDTEAHIRAAWSYINMERNASKYSAADVKSIKSRIKAAAKKHGININDKVARIVASLLGGSEIEKGLYGVQELASVYERLRSLYQMAEYEAEREHDEDTSQVCPMLEEILRVTGGCLRNWLDEELTEFEQGTDVDDLGAGEIAMALTQADIEKKYGKAHTAALEAIHKGLGEAMEAHGKLAKMHKAAGAHHETIAKCHGEMMEKMKGIGFSDSGDGDDEGAEHDDPGASVDETSRAERENAGPKSAQAGDLNKVLESTMVKALKPLTDTMAKLDERISKIEAQPAASAPKTDAPAVTVRKDDENGAGDGKDKLDPKDPDYAMKLIKFAHQSEPHGLGDGNLSR
jgi:Putative phage serine protease XkdF